MTPDRAHDDRLADLTVRFETPENVLLSFRLAGPTLRAAAYAIDFILTSLIFLATVVLLACTGVLMVLPGVVLGMVLVVLFLTTWMYFPICEGLFRGKTVGKQMMGLRVILEGGYPITFAPAFLRNVLRAADSLPLYGMGLGAMLVCGKFRRLGDLVARTLVIQERAFEMPEEPVILEKINPLPREEVNNWTPPQETLAVIEQFLRRREVVSIEEGHALARPLASVLADRLAYSSDRALVERFPMAFLARTYVLFHAQLATDDAEERELVNSLRKRRKRARKASA